nr:vesicle transport V-SNARE 13-like [Ipomoea batatas]GMC75731.1 vesicle transport V-SNARE 13-like [Ipomoea batatas]
MSQVFEGYERQYCELSANLTKKCTSASLLDGEQKKQKISEVKSGLEDAEALVIFAKWILRLGVYLQI